MIVYLVRNRINGKMYVGQSIKDTPDDRWYRHRLESSRGSRYYLHRSLRKHGEAAFDISTIQHCDSPEELNEAEVFWIEKLGTFVDGYNMTKGADGGEPNKDVRKRISKAVRGENHPFWNKCLPEETRQKMRLSRPKGSTQHGGVTKHSEATKQRIAETVRLRRQQNNWSRDKSLNQSRLTTEEQMREGKEVFIPPCLTSQSI